MGDLQKAVKEAGIEVKSNAKKSEILHLLKEFGENPAVKKDKLRLTTMVPLPAAEPVYRKQRPVRFSAAEFPRKCNEIAASSKASLAAFVDP